MPFRPAFSTTLLALALTLACASLGKWQVQRMQEKEVLFNAFENAPQFDLSEAAGNSFPYQRVRAYGQFENRWHILLDNRIHRGQPGVHVISLFRPSSGAAVLVNRGWLRLPPDRLTLPDVPTPVGPVEIAGILSPEPQPGFTLGPGERLQSLSGLRLMTYADFPAIRSAIGEHALDRVLLLDPRSQAGFEGREWQPAAMRPEQHRAYAVQWLALAAACAVGWVLLSWQRGKRHQLPGPDPSR